MEEVKLTLNTELSSCYNAQMMTMDWENAVQSFKTYVAYQEELGYGIFGEIVFAIMNMAIS